MGIGAGTPARISALIESGELQISSNVCRLTLLTSGSFSGDLKVDELERLVIDGSHIDQKQRGIFDMKDTHLPLLQLLTRHELRERYGAPRKPVKILVF